MRILLLMSVGLLFGCQTQQSKPVVTPDYDFSYNNLFSGTPGQYSDDLDLRVMVSQSHDFKTRLDQINWALDITGLTLNTAFSDFDFAKSEPSPYLSFNKLISVKHYLRLAGFKGQKIVIDNENKLVTYLDSDHPFFNDPTYFAKLNSAGKHQTNDLQTHPIDIESNAIESDVIVAQSPLNTNELTVESQSVPINTQTILDRSGETIVLKPSSDSIAVEKELVSVVEYPEPVISLPDSNNTVIEEPFNEPFKVESGMSLRNIFSSLASYYEHDFVSSLGSNKDWFLESTINHDYEFDDLDHAIFLLLKECNSILQNNNLDFFLKVSLNDGILDLYYE